MLRDYYTCHGTGLWNSAHGTVVQDRKPYFASLHLCREFGKGIKNGKNPIPLGWPSLIGKYRSLYLEYCHNGNTPYVTNIILGHYARYGIFWRKSFEARKKRLRLEARALARRAAK